MAIPPQEVSAERALVSWSEGEPNEDDAAEVTPAVASTSLRIRQIEIAGFKSFRDRTLLRFPSKHKWKINVYPTSIQFFRRANSS